MSHLSIAFLVLSCAVGPSVWGSLLDKIVAVIDDTPYTLSQVKRRMANIEARRGISPFIYRPGEKVDQQYIVKAMINQSLIRSHLTEMGHFVGDGQVERQIGETQRRLGLSRKALLDFLRNNKMTFDEYFELVKESIEFNIFQETVIRPLVSVTDQEIKNEYYKRNKENKTLSFTSPSLTSPCPDQNSVKRT